MLNQLRTIVQEVNAARDFPSVLNIIVSRVKTLMHTGMCSVYLLDKTRNAYVLAATDGLHPDAVGKVAMTAEEGLVGLVAKRAEPINLEHAETHPNFAYFPETGEEKFSSFMGAPIIHHRVVLGVLVVQQQERRRFDESEEAFLITISAQLAGVIAHAEATGAIARMTSQGLDSSNGETAYQGIASAPGIGIGTAVVVSSPVDLYAVPRRQADDIEAELALFRQALGRVQLDLRAVQDELKGVFNQEEIALFDVYVNMLEDQSLGGEVIPLIKGGLAARSAWSQVIIEHLRAFSSMENAYMRERAADVRDLGRRVLAYLQQVQHVVREYPQDAILIGEDLAAPNLADIPFDHIRAIVSVSGSHHSHLAILGRAMGIPTVMGAVDLPWAELDGCPLIVDGHQGLVIPSPSALTLATYQGLQEEELILAAALETLKDEPSATADGHHITLWVNTGLRVDGMISLDRGAEGVGLYRSEIPFFLHERFPSEEEQRQIYREQLEMFAPRPVTLRTLDIGGDKALPYFPIEEANPFLGWRGIRVMLDHPEIFMVQLRAILRASEQLDNLRILLPMISNLSEVDSALALIRRAHWELTQEEGYRIVMPLVGAMVEVPAAVYQIAELAARVDFLSVGTNDLTQYLLAVDRNNPRVAELYHSYHPAVLQALRAIITGARKANCPVSVCGELAGDPLGAILLVGMGYDTLSMSSANLLRVKAVLRQMTLAEITAIVDVACQLAHASAVRDHLEKAVADHPGSAHWLRPRTAARLAT